jgi:hypothetical protein
MDVFPSTELSSTTAPASPPSEAPASPPSESNMSPIWGGLLFKNLSRWILFVQGFGQKYVFDFSNSCHRKIK